MAVAASSELEARALAGEPQAQFDYGLLLLGERSASEGLRGVALIDSACEQGHAEAAAMSALFEAMGAARPQSWPRALDKLTEAAEAGSAKAQGQLLALNERGNPDGGYGSTGGDWRALRNSLSIERLLKPPARRILHDTPRVASFSGFASGAECEWVMSSARDRLHPAKLFHTATGGQTYFEAVRDNSAVEFLLPQMDLVFEVLRARISAATRLPVPLFEPTQVLHYAVGEQFKPHHDFLDPEAPGFAEQLRLYGQRVATVLVYLNDEYSGGDTVFPKLGISFRGSAGDALFWTNVDRTGRADPLTMHAGTPPTTGEKWIVSQWIRDRAPASVETSGG
ncbi:MAG TPA: 2OG-Fe(II) oxygenase [Sphingomicrobium sp.]|nr:2OG-Fe(II) oxygenase [Sphingomicrobium sp.]